MQRSLLVTLAITQVLMKRYDLNQIHIIPDSGYSLRTAYPIIMSPKLPLIPALPHPNISLKRPQEGKVILLRVF